MDSLGSSDDDASKCPASLLGVAIDVDRANKEQHGKVHVSYYTNGSFMAVSFGFPVAAHHRSTHGERTLQTLAGR